ncbi:hypothetical protein [Algiphilus sp.]|uniref:hypothetical protein n=1 Tax=Algiphilus sp. TaxID=1872431 RepID=UPI003CCBB005
MSNATGKTNISELITEFNAGVFEQQINHALNDIAANVCETGKKGQLVLTLNVSQIGEANQVSVEHTIKSMVPKLRGKVTEEHTTQTPLHVGRGGTLTVYPDNQRPLEMGAGAATGRTDQVGEDRH